ncbi:DJ-1/PfpI family protein [Pedobacter steynii]|uniref:DJ-1/PfpI domain-containing protein n=1 Tax=Pedobacter steynii TaxID=430522 RepID=A0A1D7QLS5_9SPHI|nr:DJ-1/PfpI family protein [Pedobacter steynii]AOM79624.1 hypothetical protein BFS30_22175 [Pedobacter steynii]
MKQIKTIGVIAYPKCGEQDTLTVLEILKSLAWLLDSQYKTALSVKLLVLEPGNILMQMGTTVIPDGVYDGQELFDLLYIPGGMGSGEASKNKVILDLINKHYSNDKVVATNCSGISILWRSGIIANHLITAPATVSEKLVREGANLSNPRKMWIGLPEQRLWTTAGGSGVHGSTVALVVQYFGEEVGKIVAAMWDALPLFGDQLLQLQGPDYASNPAYEKIVQDMMQEMLLPNK